MLATNKLNISLEFFPPKTSEGQQALLNTIKSLKSVNPQFCSVTFGAGGSTREKTKETVLSIKSTLGIEAVPHVSCIGSTKEEMTQLINSYLESDIRQLVVLRGDLPPGSLATGSDFRYANELVDFIRQLSSDHFSLYVAAYPEFHPETKQARQEISNFKRKVDAGANHAITQYFYNPDAYFYFVEECARNNINIPIIPGIMPICSLEGLLRFSKFCEAEIPKWLLRRLDQYQYDSDSFNAFATDVVANLCDTLLSRGAPGLHFYTLNKAEPTLAICRCLHYETGHLVVA